MKYEERTKIVFAFLFNQNDGLLRGYEKPSEYSVDRAQKEINLLVDDINRLIDSDVEEPDFKAIIREIQPAVRKRHGARGWPSSKVLQAATEDAIKNAQSSMDDRDTETRMVAHLADYYAKTGRQLTGCGSAARTKALIDRGTFTNVREAMVKGFDMTPEMRAEANEIEPSKQETDRHFAIMATIWNCSDGEARERYAFQSMTPEEQERAIALIQEQQDV